ncbi:hypothetical protein KW795_01935 [Candidatus Microgenomates bacterium]|nr:hypothetical protein [Candidatus Microgenomates bacterium]
MAMAEFECARNSAGINLIVVAGEPSVRAIKHHQTFAMVQRLVCETRNGACPPECGLRDLIQTKAEDILERMNNIK